jgi:hypothetical protein
VIGLGVEVRTARERSARALVELTTILRRLAGADVPAIPLKGPLLSARLFGDPTLRGSHDLDLLVPEDRMDDALAALSDEYAIHAASRRTRKGREHHEGIRSPRTNRLVEVHWRPLSPRTGVRADWNELWRTARQRTDAGIAYLTLDPAVEAVVVGVHAAQHLAYRLHWLLDVAALAAGLEESDWERALELAGRWRGYRSLTTALQAAELVLAVRLKERLARAAAIGGDRRVAAWIARRLTSGVAAIPSQLESWPRWLAMLDSWAIRGAVTTRFLFTPIPEDRQVTRLPPLADTLTGAVRPLLVVLRALRRQKAPRQTPLT